MGRAFQTLEQLGAYTGARTSSPVWVQDPGTPLCAATSSVQDIWTTQPSVRKVCDFIASQIASIPMHLYERLSDTDRPRVTDHVLARVLDKPCPPVKEEAAGQTAFRFWYQIIIDWLIYDRWAAIPLRDGKEYRLQRIPARIFDLPVDNMERVVAVRVQNPRGGTDDYDPSQVLWDAGYCEPTVAAAPFKSSGTAGVSPMQTILQILAEAQESIAYRRAIWRNGARVPVVIERDRDWSSPEARAQFAADWSNFVRGGGRAGGTPILEDGMKLAKVDAFNPSDAQEVEGRKLSDEQVAGFYHIPPELLGIRQGNYANMDAFRQGLYRESLGPYIFQIAQVVNLRLTPMLAGGRPLYVEHDLQSKLSGSFLEQAQVLQTAAGAPYMSRSEARARMNLPEIAEADKLVVPLNVLVGGQASPRDSGSQNLGGGKSRVKTRPPATYEEKATEVLSEFFTRQLGVIRSRLGASKAADPPDDWWDADRWDGELTSDLYPLGTSIANKAAADVLESLAMDPEDYDTDRTLKYLLAMSAGIAERMNTVTRAAVEKALLEDEWREALDRLVETTTGGRAQVAGAALVTNYGNWGGLEAARQVGAKMKTWITGANPRPSHAMMDGETVPVQDLFSNGCMWPGDGADAEYGCNCELEISVG